MQSIGQMVIGSHLLAKRCSNRLEEVFNFLRVIQPKIGDETGFVFFQSMTNLHNYRVYMML